MSDLQDLIHRNAELAYLQGAARERERIIELLKPLAQHDPEMCEPRCWPEDCSAFQFQYAIELIKGEQK